MSERDGWTHLYLYDGATGRSRTRSRAGMDGARRGARGRGGAQVFFRAGGIVPEQDPYSSTLPRELRRHRPDGANAAGRYHTAAFSPDGVLRRYVVPGRLAPVTSCGAPATGCHGAGARRPRAAGCQGWRAPERFVAKGRDGMTDIYGVIIRPTKFDTDAKYPVIENIYAGPQARSSRRRSASIRHAGVGRARLHRRADRRDGDGEPIEGVSRRRVEEPEDAGFPTASCGTRRRAEKYPSYDLTRVGIYGGSAGGQNALGGLLFHPDFYKAAVAFAGCHDNRMDKIWWNEQWMGWPVGPHYAESSNVVHAGKLRGKLLLVIPELDTNVDPSSTMQVVNALIKADKQFDMLVMPGEEHGAGRRGPSAPYGDRKLWDFRHATCARRRRRTGTRSTRRRRRLPSLAAAT